MIKTLYIKDFALIENCNIDFSNGLNVIIGETGSGKSMLIDALAIAFGDRASIGIVRNGAAKCIIELEIANNNELISTILKDNEIDNENESLIIRREISVKSGTRNFVNDTPVSLVLIKQIGELFIDFHGQHEHQSLLNSSHHPEIFDKAAGLNDLLSNYTSNFDSLKNSINEYKNLINKEKILKEKNEYTKYKLDEILSVSPIENEDEILESELKILENSEILNNYSRELYDSLYDSDNSAWNLLSRAIISIKQLTEIDNSFSEYKNELESALVSIKEVASFTNKYNSSIDYNPVRIEEIRLRINQLRLLKKKYGSITDILNLKSELESDFQLFSDFDKQKTELESKIKNIKNDIIKISLELESKRIIFSKIFSKNITDSLANLGITNSVFEVKIDRNFTEDKSIDSLSINIDNKYVSLTSNGINMVEFYISTNLGESLKPLRQVASGGEVSRIMLSIKNILADKDNISCLVFDEIDTGVSGRIAQMVGNSMKNLSKYHQIIAISHLPQISAISESCILVEKFENDNKTFSVAKRLSDEEKVFEVARLMSGENLSDANIKSAYELINNK
jgi:DNA repair protein RecN (Recombination protein N)